MHPTFEEIDAEIPLAFTLGFDAGAVDQRVPWHRSTAIGQAHVRRSLAAA
jgi:hypothetical protein